MTTGFTQVGVAGEAMATKVVHANERIAASAAASALAVQRQADQMYVAYPGMAAKGQKLADDLDVAMRKASDANDNLGRAMTGAGNDADGARSKHGGFRDTVSELGGGLDTAVVKLGGWKTAIAGAAVAAGLIAAATTKMAGDFEFATTKLMTSAGETHQTIGLVRQGILDMSVQVGESAGDLTEAMFAVSSANYTGANGLNVLKAAAQGAKAEGADLTIVADGLVTAMRAYGYEADQAGIVTSKLVAAGTVGKMSFQELSNSLSSVLPVAGAAKVSFDDILGSLATMTSQGMSAQQATQNMADAIRHMVAPTQVQAKELGQLGMRAGDLAEMLREKGLSGTVAHLSRVIIEHMGPSGKVMLESFNKSKDAAQAVQDMLKSMPQSMQDLARAYLSGSISAGEWAKQLKGMPVDQENLAKQFEKLVDRSKGFSDLLKSGVPAAQTYQDALRRVMGDATGMNVALMLTGDQLGYVKNAVSTVAGATTDASGNVRGWSEVQGLFNVKLQQAKAGAETLGISIGQRLLPVATAIVGVFSTVSAWLGRNQWAANALAIVIGTILVAAIIAGVVAVGKFTVALLTNPVVLITMAIIALIAGIIALIKNWDAVVAKLKEVWDFITAWVAGTWNDFINWISRIASAVGDWFSALPGKIGGWLSETGASFTRWFGSVLSDAGGWLADMGARIGGWFAGLPSLIWGAVGDIGAAVGDIGKNIVVGIWNGLVRMGQWLWDKIWGWIKSVIPGPIKSALGISSPSKLMEDEIGLEIPAGVAVGITNNGKVAEDAAVRMARGVAAAAKTGLAGVSGPGVGIGGPETTAGGGVQAPGGLLAGMSNPSQGLVPVAADSGPVVTNVTINVAGQLVTWTQLVAELQKALLRYGTRNTSSGVNYAGFGAA
jgi:TP901 family phage tail tape measure protein